VSISTTQAAGILGVKTETVYAYVSRGLLHPIRVVDGTGGRHSEFDHREVERVAARRRRGGRAGALDVLVETELTMLDPAGLLYYRGQDVSVLARTTAFEDVAALVWGVEPDPAPWTTPPVAAAAIAQAGQAMSATASGLDRVRLAVGVLAGFDPDRDDRSTDHVTAAARSMVSAGLLVQPGASEPSGPHVVHRLWAGLSTRTPADAEIAALEAALVLLTDHELAVSTLAARVAASAWADPYLVVLAGLSAVSGSLHGRTALPAAAMLRAAVDSGDVAGTVAAAADQAGLGVPGFGHKVYRGPDPRAETLLDLVAGLDTEHWPVIDAVLSAGSAATGLEANVDFALAALVVSADLPIAAGELVFGIARLVGVIGHAIEEYPHRLRFRPRAIYTGTSPDGAGPT
jgi:citrate synthase